MKRLISIIMALACLLLCLTGCGGMVSVSTSPVPEAERTKITVWYTDDGSLLWDSFRTLVGRYNGCDGATAGIRVSAKAFSSDTELLAALTAAGDDTPAAVLCGLDAALSINGVAVSTGTYFSASSPGGVASEYFAAGELDGKVRCVPIAAAPDMLMVNKTLASKLTDYSDSALSTIEGVCAAAQKYNDLTGRHFFTADSFTNLFRASLAQFGTEFHADRGQDIKNQYYVYVFNLLAEAAYNGGVTAAKGDAAKLVATGEFACAFVSTAEIMKYSKQVDAGSISILPYPVVSCGKALYPASLVEASITASGDRAQTAAAVFISWLLGNSASLTGGTGYFPTTQALASSASGADSSPLCNMVTAAVKSMAKNYAVVLPAPSAKAYASNTQFESSFRETLAGLN